MAGSNPRATESALQDAGRRGVQDGENGSAVATAMTMAVSDRDCGARCGVSISSFHAVSHRRRETMTNARTRAALLMVGAVLLAVTASSVRAAGTPEETVKAYLQAMKDQKFDDAYKQISKAMTGGKDAEAWAKEQKYIMQSGDVKIFKFDVYAAKIDGNTAKVPNILSSQDKFLNQLGADEYELYTVVKENGDWRIDQQEQVDKVDQEKWFTKKAS